MKNIFAFSLGIRYLQVAFTTSKDSKKPPLQYYMRKVQSFKEKNQ